MCSVNLKCKSAHVYVFQNIAFLSESFYSSAAGGANDGRCDADDFLLGGGITSFPSQSGISGISQ
jgi:hypothetical protein